MSVVTVEEFGNSLGGWTFSAVQKLEAQAILDGVQSDLERYLNRPLQERRVLEYVAPETWDGKAFLDVTPLVAVHGAYRTDGNGGVGDAVSADYTLQWMPGTNYVRIAFGCYLDYTGGMNGDVNPGVKAAIKTVAKRMWPHTHDSGVSVRGTETRPASDAGVQTQGWTMEELKAHDRLRRRVVL